MQDCVSEHIAGRYIIMLVEEIIHTSSALQPPLQPCLFQAHSARQTLRNHSDASEGPLPWSHGVPAEAKGAGLA